MPAPRITYDFVQPAAPRPTLQPIREVAEAAGGTLAGIAKVADVGAQYALKITEQRNVRDVSDALIRSNDELDAYRKELDADPDFKSRETKMRTRAEEVRVRELGKLGNPLAQQSFHVDYGRMAGTMTLGVRQDARADENQDARMKLQSSLDALGNKALFARTPQEAQTYLDQSKKLIEDSVTAGTITAIQARGMEKASIIRLEAAQVQEMIRVSPGAALSALRDPNRFTSLDPTTRAQLMAAATQRGESQRALGLAELSHDATSYRTARAAGQVPSEEVRAKLIADSIRLGKQKQVYDMIYHYDMVDHYTTGLSIPDMTAAIAGFESRGDLAALGIARGIAQRLEPQRRLALQQYSEDLKTLNDYMKSGETPPPSLVEPMQQRAAALGLSEHLAGVQSRHARITEARRSDVPGVTLAMQRLEEQRSQQGGFTPDQLAEYNLLSELRGKKLTDTERRLADNIKTAEEFFRANRPIPGETQAALTRDGETLGKSAEIAGLLNRYSRIREGRSGPVDTLDVQIRQAEEALARQATPENLAELSALLEARKIKITERDNDPAAFAAKYSPVANEALLAAARAGDVPAQQAAQQALLQAQLANGVAPQNLAIFTKPQLDSLVARLASENTETQVTAIRELRASYADNEYLWRTVKQQVGRANKKLPPMVETMLAHPAGDVNFERNAVEAYKLDPKDAKTLMGEAAFRRFNETFDGNSRGDQVLEGWRNASDGPQLAADMKMTAHRLATYYVVKQKMEPAQAIAKAWNDVAFDHWDYTLNNGTRIPKSDGRPIYDPQRVKSLMDSATREVTTTANIDPGIGAGTGQLSRETRQGITRDMLARNGVRWVTTGISGRETGVLMLSPDGAPVKVRGQPVFIPFILAELPEPPSLESATYGEARRQAIGRGLPPELRDDVTVESGAIPLSPALLPPPATGPVGAQQPTRTWTVGPQVRPTIPPLSEILSEPQP